MFLKSKRSYSRDGSQVASGRFLMLVQPEGMEGLREPVRALVRHVTMRQLGHFMMGIARVRGERVSVSGTYGNDGLTMGVPRRVYDAGIDVPPELVKAFNEGGGWNSAGSEAKEMHAWACATFAVEGRKA